MFGSPEAALGYWRWNLSNVDPFLLSMLGELVKPNMTVWDIGANVGLFSFAAAALGAQVLAIERDTWLANLIHRSATLNKLPVTVLPAAVSDHQGYSATLRLGGRQSFEFTFRSRSGPDCCHHNSCLVAT